MKEESWFLNFLPEQPGEWQYWEMGKTRGLANLDGEGNGNPLQYSCLEYPVDRGAWWAAVHGVAQSRTWLKWRSVHACTGEGNGNPLQYSCLENPRDRGAWWATVYGVMQSRTRLKWLSSSSKFRNKIKESYFSQEEMLRKQRSGRSWN